MSGSEKSPLARLVLFMVCLSAVGSLYAGVVYYSVDLPIQNAMALKAPQNRGDYDPCYGWQAQMGACYLECNDKYPAYKWEVFAAISHEYCTNWCDNTYGNNAHLCK